MELVFLDLMIDSIHNGLRAKLGFKKAAWIEELRIIVTKFPL